MMRGEVPVVLAKACELFITELTLAAWRKTEGDCRKTLRAEDVAFATTRSEAFDFLVDTVQACLQR